MGHDSSHADLALKVGRSSCFSSITVAVTAASHRVASREVVWILGLTACLADVEGPPGESLCVTGQGNTERNHATDPTPPDTDG